MITIDRGTNLCISNWHTLPMYLTVYPDGVAIRADGVGMHAEPLPSMTIGRIDDCALEQAVAELIDLAEQDMGDPRISDQSTTRIVLRLPGGADVDHRLRVRARRRRRVRGTGAGRGAHSLVGDDRRTRRGHVGRARLDARPAPPHLVRHERAATGTAADPAWPLDRADRAPCSTAMPATATRAPWSAGARAAAMLDALGTQPTVSPWSDGSPIASIAVGVLVPGAGGLPRAVNPRARAAGREHVDWAGLVVTTVRG